MGVQGRNMVKSKVPTPTGWPSIKTAYTGITDKLNKKASTGQKLAAIYYWEQRLAEDAALVAQGLPPAEAPPDD